MNSNAGENISIKRLEVCQVSHAFGITDVLANICLTVDVGQVVALVGPSGCGKSTLLHLCAGLLGLINGKINNSFDTTALMFQQPRLLPWKNTLDNISVGLKARRIVRHEREISSRALGLRMGLVEEDFEKYPHELSGGMQQRAALARALVLKPDLLLLDEPFSALDIGLKSELYGLLVEHLSEQHAAVLLITHDLMEAIRLSNIILLMESNPGRIVRQFSLRETLSERNNDWVYRTTAELIQEPEVRNSFSLV